jgi:hypothetical protein
MKTDPYNPDPYMGDWQGEQQFEDGNIQPLVAQVIAYDSGLYTINLMRKFDTRDPHIVVLAGTESKNVITFGGEGRDNLKWQGSINGTSFKGTFEGTLSGTFEMEKTMRLSPTLGKKPPQDAILLFSGQDLNQWIHQPEEKGYVNLAKLIGEENCVVYLKNEFWSPIVQKAHLLIGSDDGIKVWLNGKIEHQNNVLRGARADDDTIEVDLRRGWNKMLLKITNGEGGWGVLVRLSNTSDEPLDGLAEKNIVDSSQEKTMQFLAESEQYFTLWQLSDPYRKEGLGPEALFDFVFTPEEDETSVDWQNIKKYKPDYTPRWTIRDNVMQVLPGSGSILTKQKFNDYHLHLEFRSPFMPEATGQARGNSGVYNQGRYEVQILDSYGLEGKDNECGGIYKVAAPKVNMCAPPTQWQSYDIDFRAARYDKAGNKLEHARITVVHNGVTIHEKLEIPIPTQSGLDTDMSIPGPVFLQDHSDLVQYRNIWLVEK